MRASLELNRCSVRYAPTAPWVLSELNITVPQGSCCAILGPTAAGKSTLLHLLSGYLGAHHRSADTIGGIRVGKEKFDSLPRRFLFPTVGLVLQDPYVMLSGMHRTVREEIEFTLHNLHADTGTMRQRVDDTLQSLEILRLANRPPSALSGGEAQRVALASVIVAQPEVLLLDEPRNFLDCGGQASLVKIIRTLHRNTTVLFTDFQVELALAVADLILVLREGRTLFFGTRQELLRQYKQFESILFSRDWTELLGTTDRHPGAEYLRNMLRQLGPD